MGGIIVKDYEVTLYKFYINVF